MFGRGGVLFCAVLCDLKSQLRFLKLCETINIFVVECAGRMWYYRYEDQAKYGCARVCRRTIKLCMNGMGDDL